MWRPPAAIIERPLTVWRNDLCPGQSQEPGDFSHRISTTDASVVTAWHYGQNRSLRHCILLGHASAALRCPMGPSRDDPLGRVRDRSRGAQGYRFRDVLESLSSPSVSRVMAPPKNTRGDLAWPVFGSFYWTPCLCSSQFVFSPRTYYQRRILPGQRCQCSHPVRST
jgi:hypothetical protein